MSIIPSSWSPRGKLDDLLQGAKSAILNAETQPDSKLVVERSVQVGNYRGLSLQIDRGEAATMRLEIVPVGARVYMVSISGNKRRANEMEGADNFEKIAAGFFESFQVSDAPTTKPDNPLPVANDDLTKLTDYCNDLKSFAELSVVHRERGESITALLIAVHPVLSSFPKVLHEQYHAVLFKGYSSGMTPQAAGQDAMKRCLDLENLSYAKIFAEHLEKVTEIGIEKVHSMAIICAKKDSYVKLPTDKNAAMECVKYPK
jgi:hypothetical protein